MNASYTQFARSCPRNRQNLSPASAIGAPGPSIPTGSQVMPPEPGGRTVIVADASPSMEFMNSHTSRKEATAEGILRLCEIKAAHYPNDEVAIVVFHHSAVVIRPLGTIPSGLGDIHAALTSYVTDSCTNMTAGLVKAGDILLGKQLMRSVPKGGLIRRLGRLLLEAPDDDQVVRNASTFSGDIIFLSDGCYNTGPDPFSSADQLKSWGVRISTIGVGQDDEFDEATLKDIASIDDSGLPRYRHILDDDAMVIEFERLAHHIKPLEGGE